MVERNCIASKVQSRGSLAKLEIIALILLC